MKSSHWILMISTLALFSAHQTHRSGADKPDYARNPASVVRPATDLKSGNDKTGAHKVQRAKANKKDKSSEL